MRVFESLLLWTLSRSNVHKDLPPSLIVLLKDSFNQLFIVERQILLRLSSILLSSGFLLYRGSRRYNMLDELARIIYIHECCLNSQQKMVADQKLEKDSSDYSCYLLASAGNLSLPDLPGSVKQFQ